LKTLRRELLAEFLGTFVLIVFGVGSVAQAVLSGQVNPLAINVAWGLAVTMGIYIAGGVSGAHLNPAVSLALAFSGRFAWKKVPLFFAAQMAGAFVASAVVYCTYYEALNHFDGGVRQILGAKGTAGIWATYPQNFLSTFPGGFLDQIVGTALLMLLISALGDTRNQAPRENTAPILVGALVVLIGATFGFNAGYAINPARDLAPRIFTAIAGWGSGVFSAANNWWWVPIVAPCLGAILGAVIYEWLIAKHHPELGLLDSKGN
jgi:MIP family channel proteins